MQTAFLPQGVCDKANGVSRRFIWGATERNRRPSWGLIQNHDDLRVQVLRSKYCCGSDILPPVQYRQGSSNMWKGICQAWDIVLKVGE